MTDPDRRETIEAAFKDIEAEVIPTAEAPPKEDVVAAPEVDTPAPAAKAAESPPKVVAKPEPVAEVDKEPSATVERPPQAWKAPLKAKWDKLDPDIRQEVLRRERETTTVLNETARARQFEQQFTSVIQPYMARINSLNAHPLVAVGELLKADHILSTAAPTAKAQYLAKLISDYGVDIPTLDQVLSGKTPADPVDSRVERLLQERLAPFQSYMQQQEQRSAQERQQQAQHAATTVEQMSQDPKYPYFEQVRETMADLIEFSAQKGQTLGIEAAYNRAIALDPALSNEVSTNTANQAAAAKVLADAARAKKALNASGSVSGNPGGTVSQVPNAADRRATIEAAFSSVTDR
jgi:uncharacterized HAD superfamily protein